MGELIHGDEGCMSYSKTILCSSQNFTGTRYFVESQVLRRLVHWRESNFICTLHLFRHRALVSTLADSILEMLIRGSMEVWCAHVWTFVLASVVLQLFAYENQILSITQVLSKWDKNTEGMQNMPMAHSTRPPRTSTHKKSTFSQRCSQYVYADCADSDTTQSTQIYWLHCKTQFCSKARIQYSRR